MIGRRARGYLGGTVRRRLSYANVTATLALFLALGGGAYAVSSLGPNTVRSRNIVDHQVRGRDLAKPPRLRSAGLEANPTFNCAGKPPWTSSRPAVNGAVGYYRDLSGVVHLGGDAALCGANGPIFTLPRGYRPRTQRIEPVVNNDNPAVLYVTAQGQVLAPNVLFGAIVSLDGVSFRCGPSGRGGCP